MPGTRRRSAQWLISVSRDGLHARRFHNDAVSVGRFLPKYIHATWAVRDHKKQGTARKFVFVTPDSARRASRAGRNGLDQHCRLPRGGRQAGQNLNHRAIDHRVHPPGDRDRAQQIAPGNTAGRWHLRNTFADSPAPHNQTPHGEHSIAEPTRRDTQAEQNAATPAVAVTSAYPPRRSHSRMSRAAHRGGSVPTTSRLDQPIRHRAPPQYCGRG